MKNKIVYLTKSNGILNEFQEILGYNFKNIELLDQARTLPNFNFSKKNNNFQRLEFLGDRVLGLIISEEIYYRFSNDNEGNLAKKISFLVCKDTCNEIAKKLLISQFLLPKIKKKELIDDNKCGSFLSDSIEALIGAIYLDSSLESVRNFIIRNWEPYFFKIQNNFSSFYDPKSILQEWSQSKFKKIPCYKVLSISGPSHSPVFHIQLNVGTYKEIVANGPSKKSAERLAALVFLDMYCK